MSSDPLEHRIAALEAEVAQLKVQAVQPPPWWEKIAGAFADDPAFKQAMRLGQAYRKSLRPATTGKSAKRRNGHPRHRSS